MGFEETITVRTEREMEALCERFTEELLLRLPVSFVLLDGELGSGKTAFCRGFARPLGIRQTINSPTFSLLNRFNGDRGILYHYDLYRIDSIQAIVELGFVEMWEEHSDESHPRIHAIEWWQKGERLLPDDRPRLYISIAFDDEETRSVTARFES